MLKVAILCNSFCRNSGVDRVVFWQAQKLIQEGKHVTIFTFKANMDPPHNADIKIVKIPNGFIIEMIWRLFFPLDIFKMIHLLSILKSYKVVYSHHYPWNMLAYLAKKKYGIEYIYYYHHINPPESYFGFIQRKYAQIYNFMTIWTAKKADSAISISKFSQKSLLKEVGLKSEVVSNVIDNKRFHFGLNGSLLREELALEDNPVILFVGSIRPPKCIHLLIESFNVVKRSIPNAKLVIIGEITFGKYYEKLKKMSDNSVIFAGYVSDDELPSYYAACDVYATASLWEGFNLPLVEAQACGKPVVAFDIGPHKEVVDEGKTGLLVRPKDSEALADAIVKLLQDMGENGRRFEKKNIHGLSLTG